MRMLKLVMYKFLLKHKTNFLVLIASGIFLIIYGYYQTSPWSKNIFLENCSANYGATPTFDRCMGFYYRLVDYYGNICLISFGVVLVSLLAVVLPRLHRVSNA